jgi:hypothetical protein
MWLLCATRDAAGELTVGCAADPSTRAEDLAAAVADAVGAGPHTITLVPGCTYTLRLPDNQVSGLPVIGTVDQPSDLTIAGNGATIERAPDAPAFRLFAVGDGSRLTLNDLVLRGGAVPSASVMSDGTAEGGGAILNQGVLVVNRCTITGNAPQRSRSATLGSSRSRRTAARP